MLSKLVTTLSLFTIVFLIGCDKKSNPIYLTVKFEVRQSGTFSHIDYAFMTGPSNPNPAEYGTHDKVISKVFRIRYGTSVKLWARGVGEGDLTGIIFVNEKELYIDGKAGRDVSVTCEGPVHIPQEDDNR